MSLSPENNPSVPPPGGPPVATIAAPPPDGPEDDITILQMLVPYILGSVLFLVLFIIVPYMWRHGIIKSDLPTSIPDCPPTTSSKPVRAL